MTPPAPDTIRQMAKDLRERRERSSFERLQRISDTQAAAALDAYAALVEQWAALERFIADYLHQGPSRGVATYGLEMAQTEMARLRDKTP